MPQLVTSGATLMCTFGTMSSSLVVPPTNRVSGSKKPVATVMDNKPMVNIMPFGMCTSLANPQVAAATSAAGGVLTPQTCIPMTTSPWSPGSKKATMSGKAALDSNSRCMCSWAGVITVLNPGQQKVDVE